MVAATSKGTAVVTLPTNTQILITRDFDDAHINSGMEAGMQDALDLLEQVVLARI